MQKSADPPVLVIGATGTQGGAVARALLSRGRRVRILCRDPNALAAQQLIDAGVEIVRGNLDDPTSIEVAMREVAGVFSVQLTDTSGTDSERRHGFALVDAARNAGVTHFVHSSVTANGTHASFPRWGSGYWNEKYWTDKWDIESAVIEAGFPCWTVLRPAFIMENFIPPKVQYMFPHLAAGEIVTALAPDTRMQLIAGDDIGAFAAAAFNDPHTFNGRTIELAVESLTMVEIAAILSSVLERKITAVSLPAAAAIARGASPGFVRTQEFRNAVGYRVDLAAVKGWGIELTTFDQWAGKYRSRFPRPAAP